MAIRGDLGDGPVCAENPEHGRTYTMSPSKRLWCPVTQTIFAEATYDESMRTFVPGTVVREGQRTGDVNAKQQEATV